MAQGSIPQSKGVRQIRQKIRSDADQWFSALAILSIRGPQYISKEPHENDGKLGGWAQLLLSGSPQLHCGNKTFQF